MNKEIRKLGHLVVESKIEGEFHGFDGDMLFALTNKQYWIQAEYKYRYRYRYRPQIKIYNYSGCYYLTVNGITETVKVKQLTDVIEATIVNDFSGWSGETEFVLNNGQTWKQSEYAYRYHYAYWPNAIIYPSGGGAKMKVDGEVIGVRRVR